MEIPATERLLQENFTEYIEEEETTDESKNTAHRISEDPWYQVGFILITAMNSAYVLGYPGICMVPLGWIAGSLGFIAVAFISFYANYILARLHQIEGVRHIRYRDLAGYIYGDNIYYFTWALQYINLFMGNIGFIILAGEAMKAIYTLYDSEDILKLPYCIIITGIVCSIFAFGIPHLSALRFWLGISTLLSLIYISVAILLSIKDGLNNLQRDYEIPGSKETKIFNSIGASINMVFLYNFGMLPEMQATVKRPYVRNMRKALYLQFLMGSVSVYAVIFVGYWAYGSSTSSYLLNNVNGPNWVKTLANASAFLQTVISLHIFASPTYEYLDTKFGRMNESIYSAHNWIVRLVTRGAYLIITTMAAAMFPFMGDFVSLTSAVSVVPLTFVLPNHMYIKVKGKDLNALHKSWHWLNVWFFFFVGHCRSYSSFTLHCY